MTDPTPPKTHALLDVDEAGRARLTAAAPGIGFGRPVPDNVDVLVAGYPTDADLAAIRRDGKLVIPFAGLPAPTRDKLARRADLAVYNLHHGAPLVAEHALAMLLSLSRRIGPMDAALRRGDWRPRYAPDPAVALAGEKALILGYGAIGQRVAAALSALGMTVHATRRRGPFGDQPPATVWPPEATRDLIPGTRALIIALPLTPATRGLIDACALARLDRSALLVNVARGPIVDEAALYEALRDRHLFGAGLDVWWRMPDPDQRHDTPPAKHPFHDLDNVVLSPHRAAHAAQTETLRTQGLAALLADLLAGKAPALPGARVDLGEGY